LFELTFVTHSPTFPSSAQLKAILMPVMHGNNH
jgi:hypothetical protein